jgi:hypothetical protein
VTAGSPLEQTTRVRRPLDIARARSDLHAHLGDIRIRKRPVAVVRGVELALLRAAGGLPAATDNFGSGGLLFGCEQSTHPPRCPVNSFNQRSLLEDRVSQVEGGGVLVLMSHCQHDAPRGRPSGARC